MTPTETPEHEPDSTAGDEGVDDTTPDTPVEDDDDEDG